jgi:hypothetical protein
MTDLYPELRGMTVPADELMAYIYEHHDHHGEPDYLPFVLSIPLERWLRQHARKA